MNKKLYFLFVCLSSGFFVKAMEDNKKIAIHVSNLMTKYPECLTYIIEAVNAHSSDCNVGCKILIKENPLALSNYVTILSMVTKSVEARLNEDMCIVYCNRCKQAIHEAVNVLLRKEKLPKIY